MTKMECQLAHPLQPVRAKGWRRTVESENHVLAFVSTSARLLITISFASSSAGYIRPSVSHRRPHLRSAEEVVECAGLHHSGVRLGRWRTKRIWDQIHRTPKHAPVNR